MLQEAIKHFFIFPSYIFVKETVSKLVTCLRYSFSLPRKKLFFEPILFFLFLRKKRTAAADCLPPPGEGVCEADG